MSCLMRQCTTPEKLLTKLKKGFLTKPFPHGHVILLLFVSQEMIKVNKTYRTREIQNLTISTKIDFYLYCSSG